MNLSPHISLFKFNELREAIKNVRIHLKEDDHPLDDPSGDYLIENPSVICPHFVIHKGVIEFKLALRDDTEQESSLLFPIVRRELKEFEEEIVKYIGQEALDYAKKYSINLDVQDLFFDGILFSDDRLYEFLILVNLFNCLNIN